MAQDDRQLYSNVHAAAVSYLDRLRRERPPRHQHREQRKRWMRDRARAWREGVIPFRPAEMFGHELSPAQRRDLSRALEWFSGHTIEVIRGKKKVTHLKLLRVWVQEDWQA